MDEVGEVDGCGLWIHICPSCENCDAADRELKLNVNYVMFVSH